MSDHQEPIDLSVTKDFEHMLQEFIKFEYYDV